MKKTKLIMPIVVATSLASTIAPAITSCSCSVNYNSPELSTKTPKTREVASNSIRTYFLIEQKNIKEPEATKVKLTNLVVNGTSVSAVAGIIKSTIDSAGNILVTFNMSVVQTQYQAESIKFDLLLTNKKANTNYTLTDFEVKVVDTASSVEYDIDEDALTLVGETSVASGQELNVSFTLDDEYEFNEDYCDVTVNDESVKDEQGVTFDLYNGSIIVPTSLIPDGSKIKITLSTNTTNFYIDDNGLISLTNKGKAEEGELKVPETFKGKTVKGIAASGCLGAAFSSITFEKQDNITTFSQLAFANTTNLTSIEIPKNVTEIGTACFINSGITSLTFETNSTLKTIGDRVFNQCYSLATIQDIPASVTSIGNGAFATFSTSLKSIGFADTENWIQVGGTKTLVVTDKAKNVVYFKTGTVGEVPTGTNWSATGLEKQKAISIKGTHQIDISDATSTADFKVEFEGTDVTASCNYTYDHDDVVYVDTAEHKVKQTYPGEIYTAFTTTITAEYTTSNGKTLTKTFEVDLASFGSLEFTDAGEVKWNGVTPETYNIQVPTRFFKTGSDTPTTITAIADDGFKGYSASLTLPNTITVIGNSAFQDGWLQNDFELPSGVTSIGDSAFKNNGSIISCNVYGNLSGLKTIGANAFDSTGLTTVYINASVESIGDNAFDNLYDCMFTLIDSQTIVHLKNNDSKAFRDYLCIKEGLEDPVAGEYIYDNYEKGELSEGYYLWTPKS